jgi:hypothetical protein
MGCKTTTWVELTMSADLSGEHVKDHEAEMRIAMAWQ